MPFRKILVAVDFSPVARDALRSAAELAVQFEAELVVAHVWQPPVYSLSTEAPFPADAIDDMLRNAEELLAAWTADAKVLGPPKVTSLFLDGVPWDRLVGALRHDPRIDLCVVGTHGRTGLEHVLLGSVAEKVVRHAPCAVLVVRPRA